MRQDILNQISNLTNITNVIVLTHNIDFIFLQSVFLAAMKKCGHPSVTVIADAQCARESYQYQRNLLSGLGIRFRVVPVDVASGFRFHPKAILLSGADDATVFIGSGNMTFGGIRENAEIWSRFDTGNGGSGVFSALREYLADIQNLIPLSEAVDGDIEEAFNSKNHKWIKEIGPPDNIIGYAGKGKSLLVQMRSVLGSKKITGLTICVPYFDKKASALLRIVKDAGNPKTTVFVQDHRSTLYKSAAKKLPSHIQLKTVSYRSNPKSNSSSTRFIHAKYIAFTQGKTITVFSGSANCSIAALFLDRNKGNAELMSYRTITRQHFEEDYLGEFEFTDKPPVLIDEPPEEDIELAVPGAVIFSAQYDAGELLIGYRKDKSLKIKDCLVNNERTPYTVIKDGVISVTYAGRPSTVKLTAQHGRKVVSSNDFWVDIEESLRSTARGRSLVESIKRSDRSGIWKVDEWGLILDLFVQDLDYVTPSAMRAHEKTSASENKVIRYSKEDVFSSDYDQAPSLSEKMMGEFGKSSFSVQKMLLHAFGVKGDTDYSENDESDIVELDVEGHSGEDSGDAPEKVGGKKVRFSDEITLRQQKKISKLLEAMVDSMTDEEYLKNRTPKRLSTDIQIAALLLRLGLSKDWIDEDEFFDVTQKIWSVLFITSTAEQGTGWLVYRFNTSEKQEEFIDSMLQPGLSAALFAWAAAVPPDYGLNAMQFYLAQCISAGQLPWLWMGGDEKDIFERLTNIIKQTPCGDNDMTLNDIHAGRLSLLRKGAAFIELQNAINFIGVNKIKTEIDHSEISKGDILLQGRKGLCIVSNNPTQQDEKIEAICLQNPSGSSQFIKSYVIPIKQLLTSSVLDCAQFGSLHNKQIHELLNELEEMY